MNMRYCQGENQFNHYFHFQRAINRHLPAFGARNALRFVMCCKINVCNDRNALIMPIKIKVIPNSPEVMSSPKIVNYLGGITLNCWVLHSLLRGITGKSEINFV